MSGVATGLWQKQLRLLQLKFIACYLRTNTNQRTCFVITSFIQAISSQPVTSGNNDPATSKQTSPESKRPIIHNCMVTPRIHEMSISIILYSMALMSYCGYKLLISMSNPMCMSVLENIEKKLTQNLLKRAHQNYIVIINRSLSSTNLHFKVFLQHVLPGLHKLCHTAILDGRTWSKFGKHGEQGEHEKMEKLENINKMT